VLPKLPEFKIEKGTITADLLAPGVIPAIPEFKIGKAAVTAEMLAPGVLPKIPEFKIEKGTITADLLAPGVIPAIPEFKIGKAAVTAEMLAPGVLPTLKIEKGSITADLLAPGVIPKIPEFQIEKGSITADMLAKGAIPENRIAKGSITADLLAPGLIPAPMNPRDAFALKSGGLRFAESEKLPVYLVQGDTAVFAVLPAKESPNLVAGFGGNVIGKDAQGATISGGGKDKQINRAEGKYTTVGGGLGNTAGNEYATVGGGFANTSRGSASTVAGGWRNQALELDATVGGGQDNTASGFASTVSGGFNNQANGNQATIAGGLDNVAKGDLTFVAGRRGKALHNGTVVLTDGQDADFASTGENQILLRAAGNVGIDTAKPTEKLTVAGNIAPSAGGQYNLGSPALRWSTLYLGKSIDIDTLRFERNGEALLSLSPQATSLAGLRLYASGESPRVVGGHAANDVAETAVGGVIAGGGNAQGVQKVSGQYGSIGGGIGNQVSGFGATIAGGQDNRASGTAAAISGGFSNVADGVFPVIGGGVANRVTARLGVISGGYSNLVEAAFGVVAGGALNEVSGDYGFAAGRRAKVRHPGSFVWADAVDADVTTSARNQFVARASGGIQFFTNGNQTSGVLLPPGSGSWAMLSDANQKEGVRKVDPMDILERLAAMPLYTWRYRGQAAGVTHLGPTAQDFHAAFGLGEQPTHISSVDADGVALGAIQALHGRLKEKDAEIGQMRAENESLRQRLERLEKAIGGLLPAAGQE
jgi:hypothetical protein